MAKSNKELAVELYCALIQSRATIVAQSAGTVTLTTDEDAVNEISKLAELLASVKD